MLAFGQVWGDLVLQAGNPGNPGYLGADTTGDYLRESLGILLQTRLTIRDIWDLRGCLGLLLETGNPGIQDIRKHMEIAINKQGREKRHY